MNREQLLQALEDLVEKHTKARERHDGKIELEATEGIWELRRLVTAEEQTDPPPAISDGLEELVRERPAWAASEIRGLRVQVEEFRVQADTSELIREKLYKTVEHLDALVAEISKL